MEDTELQEAIEYFESHGSGLKKQGRDLSYFRILKNAAQECQKLRTEISSLKEQQPERVTKDTLRMLGVNRTGLQLADYIIHAYKGIIITDEGG